MDTDSSPAAALVDPALVDPAPVDPALVDAALVDAALVDAATDAAAEATAEAPKRRGRPKGSTAKTTRTVELTLTVSGTADGDWQAELKQGSSWLTRGLPVTAAAVSRAAQELSAELSEPIDAVIGAAREHRAAKVAALEAELEQARKALAEIDG
ncbi:DUF6319 family protein [Actinomycetes bacterium KLBMP 9759]